MAPDAVAARLTRLWAESTKPWVTVVDAGSRYDALAGLLEDSGLPVFRTVDAAMRALGRWYEARRRALTRYRSATFRTPRRIAYFRSSTRSWKPSFSMTPAR